MATKTVERCKECGFKRRSVGHDNGPHHKPAAIRAKGGKPIHKAGPMRPGLGPNTPPKSKGQGFDFSAVKQGGVKR